MFSRVNKQVRLMICFLAGLCATVFLSGALFGAKPAYAASHVRKAPTGYYYQAPVPSNAINSAFAASHQAPNFYN